METYIVINRHEPKDCPILYQAAKDSPWDKRLEGTPFLCTCPGGEHAGYFAVEAASPEEALSLVDAVARGHVRAVTGHVYTIGRSPEIPVA